MAFISEVQSGIKTRLQAFHSRAAVDSMPVMEPAPEFVKSVLRENLSSLVFLGNAPENRSVESEDGDASTSEAASMQPRRCFEFCQDPSFWKDHNVQVIIRIRPLSGSEISLQGHRKCLRQDSCQAVTWIGHPASRFTFDLVADEGVGQEKLFQVAGLPMIENCMEGYNSCMFAYGQTGSGKTHTMLGDIEGGTRRHSVNCGMIPRVFEYLFSRIQKEKEARKDEKLMFSCKCSFLEIYNEQILDLLDTSANNLQIREDVKKGVYVENLKEIKVTSARDVIHQLIQGAANRKVAATTLNQASSRSHSVLTCTIESKWESQGVSHHRFARLNLVDLAGSERQKSSNTEGERLKEATNINKSLSTLGLVIMNLVSISNGKSLHVPYRDSKLTFLLQDSLGGNAKTIIIANISPSLCCSLETLSTLKFAQRAKFIKNNAVINEDASGDVIALRMQIQHLKKEVSRLRGVVNGGGENLEDDDVSVVSFMGSPQSFKWEGLSGSLNTLTSARTTSQMKDYEIALVGAFRRDKDKDVTLKALADENQAAIHLAKQRGDEIQSLKMRLRLREEGIKRLEAIASGKISVGVHLLREKEEHAREIEALRTQVDRNKEATRFAMENLRLKEEIRRLKCFYEEGEREMMIEQVTVLQNKLLEALDWKLMHESDTSVTKKINFNGGEEFHGDNHSDQESELAWCSSITKENEFLIQKQAEMEEEREELERRFADLAMKHEEEERSARAREQENLQVGLPILASSDQAELKAMVDAIAAATEGNAEAHQKATTLTKENEELKLNIGLIMEENVKLNSRVRALVEEKNSLIELYERAALDRDFRKESAREMEMRTVLDSLEHQLREMHEENEKLMGLYENAMHERDEFKRIVSSSMCATTTENGATDEQTVHDEEDSGEEIEEDKDEENLIALQFLEFIESLECSSRSEEIEEENKVSVDLALATSKLDAADGWLSDIAKILTRLGSGERVFFETNRIWREIEATERRIRGKQREMRSHEIVTRFQRERKLLAEHKLEANLSSKSDHCSSRLRLEQKEQISHLQVRQEGIHDLTMRLRRSETEIRKAISDAKSKLEEENRRQQNDKILFAIDNIESVEIGHRNWLVGSKATEILKSEEEKAKLQNKIKIGRENLHRVRTDLQGLDGESKKIDAEIRSVRIEKESASQVESTILEYHESVFETCLKEAEANVLEDGLLEDAMKLEELRIASIVMAENVAAWTDEQDDWCCGFFARKMEAHLQSARVSICEARKLLQQTRLPRNVQ